MWTKKIKNHPYVLATCRTNLDEYKYLIWPTLFVSVPRLGDSVAAECGKKLKVVQITHKMEKTTDKNGETIKVPIIEVELHKGL